MIGGSPLAGRAAAVAAGLLLDRLLGDPPNAAHPTAWFGTAMTTLERRIWADNRWPGVAYAAAGVALGAGSGLALERVLPRALGSVLPTSSGEASAARWSVAIAVTIAVAGRTLRATGAEIERALLAGDLDGARAALPSLVGRDPTELGESGMSAAVIESLAENTVDAVVSPAFWAVLFGAPGALGYRAINTMDAMVGHRSSRYESFGWAAAKVDDVANWVPARLFALLVIVAQPVAASRVLRVVARDAGAHPSPNAGVAETAVAAAIGRQLGGPLRYGERVEERPRLGDGPRPQAADITAGRDVVDRAEQVLVAMLLAMALCAHVAGGRRPA